MISESRLVPQHLILISLTLAIGFLTSCGGARQPPQEAARPDVGEGAAIQGTATYREPIALPPDAVFEAVLQDVSIADAPAEEIARTTIPHPSNPPIRFAITFDPARIDSRRTYSVSARILVDGQPRFASDAALNVLTRGAGHTVDIVLKMVRGDAQQRPPAGGVADTSTVMGSRGLLGGEMVYMADAARFTDCATGQSYPIAMEGDFVKMQQAYLKDVKEPGARLYVTAEGSIANRPRMEGPGVEPSVVVRRFISAWPNQTCERSRADASLTNSYWRIQSIDVQPVSPEAGRREPHLRLRSLDQRQTYVATVGCNQLTGSYTVTGDRIAFSPGPATLMACLPPLDALEKRLTDAIARTRRWQIKASTLELMDEGGSQVALLEAVPM